MPPAPCESRRGFLYIPTNAQRAFGSLLKASGGKAPLLFVNRAHACNAVLFPDPHGDGTRRVCRCNLQMWGSIQNYCPKILTFIIKYLFLHL